MDVHLLAVGRLKAGPERDLCDRYLERARKTGARLGFRAFSVKEVAESRAARSADRAAEEAEALIRHIGEGGRTICLDEAGDAITSEELARGLSRDAEAALPRVTFVVGGPDGLAAGVLAQADCRVSLGRMTWPHQLARVLLAEQLYRGMTILSGHPYHRA